MPHFIEIGYFVEVSVFPPSKIYCEFHHLLLKEQYTCLASSYYSYDSNNQMKHLVTWQK